MTTRPLPPRHVATHYLWTDAELAAAHALVSSVMTPAAPAPTPAAAPIAKVISLPLTPQRAAFNQREKSRHSQIRRKKRAERIGSKDASGIWSNGNHR